MKSDLPQQGFTLIEVLVALAIIAIALGALLSTSGSQANSAAYLKQKTIAHWVAMNEIAELQIEKRYPDLGTASGSTEMAGVEWFWTRETEQLLKYQDAREVTYTIYMDKSREQNITRVIGFVLRQ